MNYVIGAVDIFLGDIHMYITWDINNIFTVKLCIFTQIIKLLERLSKLPVDVEVLQVSFGYDQTNIVPYVISLASAIEPYMVNLLTVKLAFAEVFTGNRCFSEIQATCPLSNKVF